MRFLLPILLLATAGVGGAQVPRSARAFEPAVSPWLGIASFGKRQSTSSQDASYRSSLTFGVRGEIPVTQRIGVMGNVGFSPLAKQRTEDAVGTTLHERVMVYRADLALAWRFIPQAPVFFFAGGGVLGASKPAMPDFDESVTEPRGLFGLGYDRPASGRWNFRVVATGFITKASDPDPLSWSAGGPAPNVTAKSSVFDWAFEFGARYRLRRGS